MYLLGVTFKFPSHFKHLNSASHALYEANLRQLDQEEEFQLQYGSLTENGIFKNVKVMMLLKIILILKVMI